MEGRYDGNPVEEEDVNPFSEKARNKAGKQSNYGGGAFSMHNPIIVPTASSSHFSPLPPEPAEISAKVDPLDSSKDLKKREKKLQAREAELNNREKDLKRTEEAAARASIVIEEKNCSLPADVQNIFNKYGNMWLKEFASAISVFENSVREIHMRNTSALKAELISALTAGNHLFDCNEAKKGNPSSLTEKRAVKDLKRDLPGVRNRKGLCLVDTDVVSTTKAVQARCRKNTSDIQDVAIIYDERMLAHKPPEGELWSEIPDRLSKIKDRLLRDGLWQRCQIFECEEAETEILEAVHAPAHVSDVKMISSEGKEPTDEDLYYSIGTTKASLLAAGGALKAADLVAKGKVQAAFAIVRPPGHHVGISGPPRGFCFLNNISVAAAHLLKEHGMKKILLLDWDIHHGDGTQEIFYSDKRVLFFSVHRGGKAMYPRNKERTLDYLGEGSGLGYNVNICWPHEKIRDVDYHVVWDHVLVPICQEFKPEMILISAGFDAVKGDDLGKCDLTPNGFATLLRKLKPLAPIAMALEGGYNMTAISQSSSACLKVLLGDKSEANRDRSSPYTTTLSLVSEAKQKLKPYWKCMDSVIPEDVWNKTIAPPNLPKGAKAKKSEASLVPG